MKNALASVLLVLWLCPYPLLSLSQSSDTDLINKYIAKQASQVGGEEYPDARKVVEGDLNGDGVADLAVLYTIEGQGGSNNHIQYLAVFLRESGRLVPVTRAKVGGRLYRDVELQSISKNVILLTTLAFTAKDPACCPSKKGEARYVLEQNKLKEQKNVLHRK